MISTVTFFAPALSLTHLATHFASSDVAAKAGTARTAASATEPRKSFIDSISRAEAGRKCPPSLGKAIGSGIHDENQGVPAPWRRPSPSAVSANQSQITLPSENGCQG